MAIELLQAVISLAIYPQVLLITTQNKSRLHDVILAEDACRQCRFFLNEVMRNISP